jgi:hypothetical protein
MKAVTDKSCVLFFSIFFFFMRIQRRGGGERKGEDVPFG